MSLGYRFKWVKNVIKYLGVHLGDLSELMKNWEGVVEKALAFTPDVQQGTHTYN